MNVDQALKSVESSVATDKEILRVLKAFRLDAYSLLELQPGCSNDDIRKLYRKKSLLIHPDKTENPKAPEAFDLLKKAEKELSNEESRIRLDNKFTDARRMLILERKWSLDDERLKGEEFLLDWRDRVKELLIEDEVVKKLTLKQQMEQEGLEKQKQEQLQNKRQEQLLVKKLWDDQRDARVDNWRNYLKRVEKKKLKLKTKKPKLLV